MKRLIFAGALTAVILSGCGLFSTDAEIAAELAAKAEALQPLLPVLTAAQSLYVPDESVTQGLTERTLNPGTTSGAGSENWIGKKPSAIAETSSGVVSVGSSSDLMEDLNGSSGDDYYFTLSYFSENPADAGATNLFKVSLFIYPTTSSSVYYILEEYLVSDETTWPMVNSSGVPDGLAFISYETHYYDGAIDYRTPIAAYYSNPGTHYALEDLFDTTAHDDPKTSTGYTYPENPLSAVSTRADQYNEYSVLISGTLPATGMKFYEFYGEGNNYLDRRSASYLFTDLSQSYINGTEKTVRRYQYDVGNGKKKVRSKTVTVLNLNGAESVKTTYEVVDIDMNLGTYNSTVTQEKVSGSTTTSNTTVTTLTGGTPSGTYTGTVTVTSGTSEVVYNAALTSANGLVLTDSSGNTVLEGYNPVALEEGQRLITLELTDGSTIEGIITRGILNGLIKSGRVADVIIGPDYVQVVYNKNKHTQ